MAVAVGAVVVVDEVVCSCVDEVSVEVVKVELVVEVVGSMVEEVDEVVELAVAEVVEFVEPAVVEASTESSEAIPAEAMDMITCCRSAEVLKSSYAGVGIVKSPPLAVPVMVMVSVRVAIPDVYLVSSVVESVSKVVVE